MQPHVLAVDRTDAELRRRRAGDADDAVAGAHQLVAARIDGYAGLPGDAGAAGRHGRTAVDQELDVMAVDLALDPEMAVDRHRDADDFALLDRRSSGLGAEA